MIWALRCILAGLQDDPWWFVGYFSAVAVWFGMVYWLVC